MRHSIILCSSLFLLLTCGCTGFVASDIKNAMNVQRSSYIDTANRFDESKIIYIKDLRCYAYRTDPDKKDTDNILFDRAGRKILSKEEALERVWSAYTDTGLSATEKGFGYAVAVYGVPVDLAFSIGENIALLPTYPYVAYLRHKFEKKSFENYREGQNLLKEGRHSQARERFYHSLSWSTALLYQSDIYFQIAETYDRENLRDLAAKYYKTFLEYSIALYPDYFEKYDKSYVDNRPTLDKEFTLAEQKLKVPSLP